MRAWWINVYSLGLFGNIMFEPTIALFDQYYRFAGAAQLPGFSKDLGCEVRERLQQLDYIINRVKDLEALEASAFRRSNDALKAHSAALRAAGIPYESVPASPDVTITKEEFASAQKASFELKLLTESFYYLAGRIRTITKHKSRPLPELGVFECEGVRNVRNHLLEHAGGSSSQIFIQSFGSGGPNGPVIKAMRYGGQEQVFPDVGLYQNAEQFKLNFERVLGSALSRA